MRITSSDSFKMMLAVLLGGIVAAIAAPADTAAAGSKTAPTASVAQTATALAVATTPAHTAQAATDGSAHTSHARTALPTSFEQDMFNNMMRSDASQALAEGIKRANPANKAEQPTHLSAFSHSDAGARAAILEKFPVGITASQILREFPQHFVLFDVKADDRNGVHIQQSGDTDASSKKHPVIGTRSIVLTVDKYFPAGIAPVIQYRMAYLAFDAEGHLLEINVITAIDGS